MTAYGIALTMVIVGAFGLGWHFGRAALRKQLDRLYRERIEPTRMVDRMAQEWVAQDWDGGHVHIGPPLYDQEQER